MTVIWVTDWQCPTCGRRLARAALPVHCLCERSRYERRARIAKAAAEVHKLIHWLTFFRHSYEAGVGDTVARLLPLAKQGSDLRTALEQLNRQCGCKPREARHELNRQYPYYHA